MYSGHYIIFTAAVILNMSVNVRTLNSKKRNMKLKSIENAAAARADKKAKACDNLISPPTSSISNIEYHTGTARLSHVWKS